MKQTKKTSFVLRAACVLLCLVLISAHFTSGLYAKYIVSATGSDTGRTASFRVSAAMGFSPTRPECSLPPSSAI